MLTIVQQVILLSSYVTFNSDSTLCYSLYLLLIAYSKRRKLFADTSHIQSVRTIVSQAVHSFIVNFFIEYFRQHSHWQSHWRLFSRAYDISAGNVVTCLNLVVSTSFKTQTALYSFLCIRHIIFVLSRHLVSYQLSHSALHHATSPCTH